MTGVMVFVFPLLMTLISLAGAVVIIMLIVRGAMHGQNLRKQAFDAALARGVYDRGLLTKKSKGVAPLGWGIFFVAIGVAMIIGFATLGILGEGATGALIPLFVGIGLIIFYMLTRHLREEERNGKPIEIPPTPADGKIVAVDEEGSDHGAV